MNKEIYDFLCLLQIFLNSNTCNLCPYQFRFNKDFMSFLVALNLRFRGFLICLNPLNYYCEDLTPSHELNLYAKLLLYKEFDLVNVDFCCPYQLNLISFSRVMSKDNITYSDDEKLIVRYTYHPLNLVKIEICSTPEEVKWESASRLCLNSKNKFYLMIINGKYTLLGNNVSADHNGILVCILYFEVLKKINTNKI